MPPTHCDQPMYEMWGSYSHYYTCLKCGHVIFHEELGVDKEEEG